MYVMLMGAFLTVLLLVVAVFAMVSFYFCAVAVVSLSEENKNKDREDNVNFYGHIFNIISYLCIFILFVFAYAILSIGLYDLYMGEIV